MKDFEHNIIEEIFRVTEREFEELSLSIFRFQYTYSPVYREFCQALNTNPAHVKTIKQIPFLPIQFFKSRKIITSNSDFEVVFESSGTTGSVNSKHFVKDSAIYLQSFLSSFRLFYGDPSDYCIIGLLPSYLERSNSSLLYMVNDLIKRSAHSNSGFYLYEHEELKKVLLYNEENKIRTILIGVTYALLDFADIFKMNLAYTTIMETGGMKGRREELTRAEVHERLTSQLGVSEIHSEYGMTELLSQAYSKGAGIFRSPPWMKIILRMDDDPFEMVEPADIPGEYRGGAVNVIDLANLNSCSFLATDDIGKLYPDGCFEILGRLDNSDIRGCGLMVGLG